MNEDFLIRSYFIVRVDKTGVLSGNTQMNLMRLEVKEHGHLLGEDFSLSPVLVLFSCKFLSTHMNLSV